MHIDYNVMSNSVKSKSNTKDSAGFNRSLLGVCWSDILGPAPERALKGGLDSTCKDYVEL